MSLEERMSLAPILSEYVLSSFVVFLVKELGVLSLKVFIASSGSGARRKQSRKRIWYFAQFLMVKNKIVF